MRVAILFSVLEPAPLAATPTVPPAAATHPEITRAVIVSRAVAVAERLPPAFTLEFSRYAWTSASCFVRVPFELTFHPMRFRAREAPMDAPIPAVPPTATE